MVSALVGSCHRSVEAKGEEQKCVCNSCHGDKDSRELESGLAARGDNAQADRTNLDSGYAWFILLIMFLLQSSISGASRVYGIVYAKQVSIGYYDREQASWPIASASAVENLASILTPALASFLSWRQIELMSTSLFICSNLLAYFSDSLWLDVLALGLIQGLALSTCTVLSLVINNDYFERYRTTAYGIQMSGSTFGVLYLSPLVSWVLADYEDFRLVYLMLALVFCANMFLVLFIKPRAKTINSGQRARTAAVVVKKSAAEASARRQLTREASEERQFEIERVKKFLESLDSEQQKWATNQSALGGGGGGPLTRKLSRFESHFERQNSIASISYEARSRRQSLYSRARVSVRPQQSCNSVYTLDGTAGANSPLAGVKHTNMIIKSKSGIDLSSKLSGKAARQSIDAASEFDDGPATGAQGEHLAWSQRISSNQARLSTTIVDADHQLSAAGCEPKLGAKLSVTNSRASSPDNHLCHLSTPLDGTATPQNATARNETKRDLHDDNAATGAVSSFEGWQLGSNNASSLDVADLESGQHHHLSSPTAASLPNNQQRYLATTHDQCARLAEGVQKRQSAEEAFSLKRTLAFLRLPYLHCTWMMLTLYYLIARLFVIILVDFADDHGFSLEQSTHLLNYWSLGELVGRILLGSLIDLQYMSCKNCIVLTCTLLAGTISFMVMVDSYVVYAACSMCIAALISLEYMLINVMMIEYIGKEHVATCYPLAAFMSSLVLFARPTLIGLFRDHLGSYDGLLMLLAALSLLLSIIFYALEPVLVRRWPKRRDMAHG